VFALADLVPYPIARLSEIRDEPRRADDNAALSWFNVTGKRLVLHIAKRLGTDDVAATEWSNLVLVDRRGVASRSRRGIVCCRANTRLGAGDARTRSGTYAEGRPQEFLRYRYRAR
jgi:hypothetical protein